MQEWAEQLAPQEAIRPNTRNNFDDTNAKIHQIIPTYTDDQNRYES